MVARLRHGANPQAESGLVSDHVCRLMRMTCAARLVSKKSPHALLRSSVIWSEAHTSLPKHPLSASCRGA